MVLIVIEQGVEQLCERVVARVVVGRLVLFVVVLALDNGSDVAASWTQLILDGIAGHDRVFFT